MMAFGHVRGHDSMNRAGKGGDRILWRFLLLPQPQLRPLTVGPSKLNGDVTLERAKV